MAEIGAFVAGISLAQLPYHRELQRRVQPLMNYFIAIFFVSLGIDMTRVVLTLPTLGNCVAASIPLTLYEAIHSGVLKRGERCLMLGTGAGLSLGAALLTY